MSTACHYSIVRFQPFVETGEFANVGIVVFAPSMRYFSFKLMMSRHSRVTSFFDQLDVQTYKSSLKSLREELERVRNLLKTLGFDRRQRAVSTDAVFSVWDSLVKPRATMVRFSTPRVLMVQTDIESKLKELFSFYIERSFATKEYQEKALERTVRELLRGADLQGRFQPQRVGSEEYHAQFPFVESRDETPIKIIKPLSLAYVEASKIIDHGGQWIIRISALKKRDLLPTQVLFAIDGSGGAVTASNARKEVTDELLHLGVTVVPHTESQKILSFAAAPAGGAE
jgi:hypothetical protein